MKNNTKDLDQQITALLKLREEDIDTTDIPEVTDWSKAVVGKFYRPLKKPITIRLDADIVAVLREEGRGYQTRINALLRKAMSSDSKEIHKKRIEEEYSEKTLHKQSDATPGEFRFPHLESKQVLGKWCQVADIIEKRGCVFGHAA